MYTFSFSKKSIVLNKEQYHAVTRPENVHQRIIASAGSGKTTTLTARIAYLIEVCKVPSNRIVLLSFSRNAAYQMKYKLEELIGQNDVWVGTFHGLCKNLLQTYDPKMIQTLYFVDELVCMGINWFKTFKGRAWVGKLRYIFVDEFQDINASQWAMIESMQHPAARLIVVGDDCQNIYTWRGSNVDFILNFEKKIKPLCDDQLYVNYRSSNSIIQVANAVMKNIPTLEWKHTMIAHLPKHKKPEINFFYRACDETSWILKQIQQQIKHNPKITVAIMARMNQDLYRFEEECIIQSINYKLHDIGGDKHSIDESPAVDLVTVHTSKGLEWDIVYLVHCNDDVFPSSKKKENIVHERRLFYVAVTRARAELYFSYTNDERNLCRFIREIPNTLLTYNGLARYMLSEFELGKSNKRLVDILGSLTTEDIQKLRSEGYLDWFATENLTVESLYPLDLYWKKPDWIQRETLSDFQRFLNVWLKRNFCSISGIPYRDPVAEKLIFTLRIFAEDLEFWKLWKDEIRSLVHMCFETKEQKKDPPNMDYITIENWARSKDVPWNCKDIVVATNILGKIRGQLRPLRFFDYDINEFTIGPLRFVVPIQWRGEVLESWRKVSSKLSWKECLTDIWKIGALTLVAEGRNVAMYRTARLTQHLTNTDFQMFLDCVERYTSIWISKEPLHSASVIVENANYIQEIIDLQTEEAIWSIGGENNQFNSLDLLRLAIASTFFQNTNFKKVGIFIPLDGKLFSLILPKDIQRICLHILDVALSKS